MTHISDTDKRPLAFVAQGGIEPRSWQYCLSVAPVNGWQNRNRWPFTYGLSCACTSFRAVILAASTILGVEL